MASMRVTVCELPDAAEAFTGAWEALLRHVRTQRSELVLLPEMPFHPWFATTPEFDAQTWQRAEQAHEHMFSRLSELAPAIVLATHPTTQDGRHLNRAFAWTEAHGYAGVHDKYYLPDEPDFYEARWFDRPAREFALTRVGQAALGFLICSELMFTEWARHYGRQGAHLLAVPRASVDHARWSVAARMAAISAGAFVLSSNRVGGRLFGGQGWVISPDGDILAATSRAEPFATVAIDLDACVAAKRTYPRDLAE